MSDGGQPDPEEAAQTPTPGTFATAHSPTLDELLSPVEATGHFPIRDSVAASDVADDENRFSTVALSSARQSFESARISLRSDEGKEHDDRRDTIAFNSAEATTPLVKHAKSPSATTVLSAHNVPYMSRLDQEEENGGDEAASKRSSASSQKVQEDFARKQRDLQQQERQEEENSVDWDFWGNVVSDYQKFASEHPEELAAAIGHGIPKTIRGMMWQLMTASKDSELENTYVRLLKETSPHEKAITRDLGRTFPHHAFFTDGRGIGQENLFNVLKAYSLYDTQVGYCQGLPFVAAVLLLHMPDEEAFCLLVRLMYSYDLRGHFLPEMPKLQLRLFQFEKLIEEMAPVLHFHFLRQNIKSSMYASQWFLTMFSYRFPMDVVFRIFDNVFASGIEALFSFSLVLLLRNEEALLEHKFDQLVSFLNVKVFDIYKIDPPTEDAESNKEKRDAKYDVDRFVEDAFGLKISSFMLDSYAEEYEELVRTRNQHAIEMDALRNSNRNLSAQVKQMESSLAQLNTEHCDLLTELVKARLKHEELESELVRYKLLYAEAMHQSEDAMSSHRISLAMSKRSSSNGG
ncbi:rab-GTPase-TBC domain-containing protein [Rhodofomes roseus]|uniref:Rab-GTPase-TBC domain-containing protein n=1 Tax=Rhodofomes roseus TaxID=34475 RepID=A0ABQ8KMW2_9APHY|nr:rab-GTPase-TBC domain-containing protein [Rhodofomes roseus]KAH9839454.1 rab-GTPase-TBC domain-containing protein [Rhodofomes roseus]